MLEVLKLFVASRNADDQRGPLPGRTRPQLRLRDAGSDPRSGRRSSSAMRSQRRVRAAQLRRAGEEARRRQSKAQEEGEEEASRRSRIVEAASRPAATAWCRPAKPAKPRRRRRPQGQRRLPGLLPDPPARRRLLRRKQPLRTHPGPARLPPQGQPTSERHAAYRMVAEYQPEYDGIHYFGMQGIQGWSDPPILDNPSETRTIHGREYEIFVDGDASSWSPGTEAKTPTGSPTACCSR